MSSVYHLKSYSVKAIKLVHWLSVKSCNDVASFRRNTDCTVYDGAHTDLQQLGSFNANLILLKHKLDSFDENLNSQKRKLDFDWQT